MRLHLILIGCLILVCGGMAQAEDGVTQTEVTGSVTVVPTVTVTPEESEDVSTDPAELTTEEGSEIVTTDLGVMAILQETASVTIEPTVTVTPEVTESVTVEPTVTVTPTATESVMSDSGESATSEVSILSYESDTAPLVTLGTVTVTGSGSGARIALNTSGASTETGYSYNGVSGDNYYTIFGSNAEYYLEEDISTTHSFAIEITASDVTLDGNGKTITFTGSDNTGTSGVLIDSGVSGVTVENFAGISGFEHGISAYGEDAVIENNNVYGNDYGIYSNNTSATIFDNNASRNVYGIWSSGNYANISDNIACFNNATGDGEVTGGYGIWSSGVHATISGNNVSFNSVNASREVIGGTILNYKVNATGGYGIYSTGNDVTIGDNIARNNSATAILTSSASSSGDVASFRLNSARVTGGYGIESLGSNATITNNIAVSNSAMSILNGSVSVFVSYYDTLAVSDSNCASATGGYGIESTGSNATIMNNTAISNSAKTVLSTSGSCIGSGTCSGVASSNFASATGGYGIESTGSNATIMNNAAVSNSVTTVLTASSSSAISSESMSHSFAKSNSAAATGGYGIDSTGNNVIITNNTVVSNSAKTVLTASVSGSPSEYGSGEAVSNSASATGGYGIDSTGNNAFITNNTAGSNSAMAVLTASVSSSGSAYSNSNSASAAGGYGIDSIGSNANITNNTANANIATVSATALANGVSQATTTSLTGGFGINTTGNDATITDNRVSGNRYGIGISDSSTGLTMAGNYLNYSTVAGLNISTGTGTGDGSIYNNYFGNDLNVCATASSASRYHWNNTEPTLTSSLTGAANPETNVVSGRYLAGNYWSNANGNGWSDQQTPNETGYSSTAYEVTTGVYDNNPLIGTLPTATPTTTPTVTPTTTSTADGVDYFADQTDTTSPTTGVHLVISTVTLPDGSTAGNAAELSVTLSNTGSIELSPQARIVLTPANALAQAVGEQPAISEDGKYLLTFSLQIPPLPGTYVYTFKPVQITRDPSTGEDIRIPAGDVVLFTVTVGTDGIVTVRSP